MFKAIHTKTSYKAAALLALVACTVPASAQQPGPQIMPNYREADLRQVVEAVGEVTGRNFLVDPRVTGQVTFLSYSPMSPEAFYEAFLATLQIHGFVAVEADGVIKIVPDATARVHPGVAEGPDGDRIVTQTVQLANVGAAQLVPILRPLIPQYGHLAAHPGTNTLIIVDRGSNVNRMLDIIGRMDQSSDEEIEIIRLENASAGEIVTMLGALDQASVAEGIPPMQLAADDRTNSILLTGPTDRRLRYRALIAHLDTPSGEDGNAQVRYLNYASAEELAANLQTQFGGAAGEAGTAEEVNIWADTGTNSLIINAPARIMQDMNTVIDRLDIRRAQVQVDAIIVEVSERRAGELGVTWGVQGAGDDSPIAGTNFSASAPGILQVGAAAAGSAAGEGAGQLGALTQLPDGLLTAVGRITDSGTSWAALVTALAGDSATNIIATPTIVTLDNEQAEISVGSEVPFLTGQFTNTGAATGSVNPFQTINRSEVGTRLAITPQINEGTGVKLLIEQETSSISEDPRAIDLVTDSRRITTSVFVDDGNILVLGGLIDDQLREVEQRVPVLGQIPGLGALFRSQSTETEKINLMVFIRPTIMRDSVQAAFQTNAKYRYIRDLQLQRAQDGVPLMSDVERPLLPPLEEAQSVGDAAGGEPNGGVNRDGGESEAVETDSLPDAPIDSTDE